jgi:hypothetical protein
VCGKGEGMPLSSENCVWFSMAGVRGRGTVDVQGSWDPGQLDEGHARI